MYKTKNHAHAALILWLYSITWNEVWWYFLPFCFHSGLLLLSLIFFGCNVHLRFSIPLKKFSRIGIGISLNLWISFWEVAISTILIFTYGHRGVSPSFMSSSISFFSVLLQKYCISLISLLTMCVFNLILFYCGNCRRDCSTVSMTSF